MEINPKIYPLVEIAAAERSAQARGGRRNLVPDFNSGVPLTSGSQTNRV